jgi:hypothetical protein
MVSRRLNPTDTESAKHHAVRLDDETRSRIYALIPHLSQPWHRATISDVLRALILSGLDVEEPKARAAERAAARATKTAKKK